MLKNLTIVLGMAVAVAGTTTVSSFVFVPEAQALGFKSLKKAAKKVGRKAKKGGKVVGRTAKKGGKAVGRTAKKGGKAVGRTAKKGGKKVRGGARKVFLGEAVPKAISRYGRKTGRIAKRGGRAFKRYVECIQKKGNCGRIGPLPAGTKGNPRPAVRDHRS